MNTQSTSNINTIRQFNIIPKYTVVNQRNITNLPNDDKDSTEPAIKTVQNIDYFSVIEENVNDSTESSLKPQIAYNDHDKNTFVFMLKAEDFETGIVNESEEFIIKLMKTNLAGIRVLLNAAFMENYDNKQVLVGILHIISHFPYSDVFPEAQTMAIAAIRHKSTEVQEYGVKCYENWQHKDAIKILSQINCSQKWLQEYIQMVINDLQNA